MSDEEIDLGPVVTIEHDKSGRATCKSARCLYDSRTYDQKLADAGGKKPKIKGGKIEKGVLRVQKKVELAAFGDREVAQNFHLACFCMEQTHSRPATHIVQSTDQLQGFNALKRTEQDIVTKMLERSVTLWNRWKGHMSRRTFTEDEEKERADEAEDWLKMAKGEEITERHYDYDPNDIDALKKAAAKRKAESAAESGESPKKRVKKEPKVKDEDEDETSVKKNPKVKKETVKKEPGVKKEAGVKKESKAADASNDGFDTSGYALEEASSGDKQKTAFQKLMARPQTLGMMKTIPDGAPDCLSGLTFVLSGVLDSLTYDDAKRLIENYGGRVTSAVSGKTSYLLRGEDAGAAKTSKAEQLGTKIIDEDGLIELLKTMPAGGGGSSATKSKPKAKRAPKKKKNSDDEDDEEEEEEKPKPLTKQVGQRAMPSFL